MLLRICLLQIRGSSVWKIQVDETRSGVHGKTNFVRNYWFLEICRQPSLRAAVYMHHKKKKPIWSTMVKSLRHLGFASHRGSLWSSTQWTSLTIFLSTTMPTTQSLQQTPGFFQSWVKKTWSLWTLSTRTTTQQERCYPQPFLRTNFAHWLESSSKRSSSTSLKFRSKENQKSMQVNSGDRFRVASLPALQSARETQTFTALMSKKTAPSSKCFWENSLPY